MGVRSGVGRHFGQDQASKGSTDQDTRFCAGIRNEPETLLTNFWRTTLDFDDAALYGDNNRLRVDQVIDERRQVRAGREQTLHQLRAGDPAAGGLPFVPL